MILWGRTEKCLKETAEEIALSGTECHYFVCDVANREEVYKQAKVIREKVRQPRLFLFTSQTSLLMLVQRQGLNTRKPCQ